FIYGGNLAAKVRIEDTYGNLISDATDAITISLTDPDGAIIIGTVTVNAVDGVASFDNLTLSKAGTYTLTATSDGLADGVSNTFEVTQRAITLQADTATKVYGESDPALSVSVTSGDLVDGDNLSEITGTLTRESGDTVGTYNIYLGTGSKT